MTTPSGPRVSILLATHGADAFISQQLASIARQSIWREAELVIVANDPSPRERSEAERFRLDWPKQVQQLIVPRESLYASWNRGIEAATADVLAIANVDDLRSQTGLEAQLECLDANPEALFSYGTFSVVKEFGGTAGRVISPPEFDTLEFTRGMHAGPFFAWRKAFGGAHLYFDEQFRSGGDFDFAVRLAWLGRGIRVGELLGHYYDAGAGLSTGSPLQPVERTVVELRYGIYDKLDYDYLPDAMRYNICNLYWEGAWHPVAQSVPEYEARMLERRRKWLRRGFRQYYQQGWRRWLRTSFGVVVARSKGFLRAIRGRTGATP